MGSGDEFHTVLYAMMTISPHRHSVSTKTVPILHIILIF
jgi:hypothetical protein